MEMMGRIIAGLVVIGLAVGVWALWPREETGVSTTSTTTATTTSTTAATTTTTEPETTTIASPEAGIIDTVEEAEAVLTDLWFGWFEGIYNQDIDRIKEVVASQRLLDNATIAFGATFESAPTPEQIQFLSLEILRASTSCTAIHNTIDVSGFRGEGATASSLEVLRKVDDKWKFVASWANPGDLWEADCDSQLEPLQ